MKRIFVFIGLMVMLVSPSLVQAQTVTQVLSAAQGVRDSVKPYTGYVIETVTRNGYSKLSTTQIWGDGLNRAEEMTYPDHQISIVRDRVWYALDDAGEKVVASGNVFSDNLLAYGTDYTLSLATLSGSKYLVTGLRKTGISTSYPEKIEWEISATRNTVSAVRYFGQSSVLSSSCTFTYVLTNGKWLMEHERIWAYEAGVLAWQSDKLYQDMVINQTITQNVFAVPGVANTSMKLLTAGVFSVQSVAASPWQAGGGGYGEAYLAPTNLFQSGDIELTQGIVRFQEEDLVLPGKNGLDVKIVRQYNSRQYRSEANQANNEVPWGGWMGHGWSMGFAQRAFVTTISGPLLQQLGHSLQPQKIMIETGDGMQVYRYDSAKGYCAAEATGNFNRAEYVGNKILLRTDSGQIWTYEELMYDGAQWMCDTRVSSQYLPLVRMVGYYLTDVQDLQGNHVTYRYEQYEVPQQLCREYTSNRDSILDRLNKSNKCMLGGIDAEIRDRFSYYLEAAVKFRKPHFGGYNSEHWRYLKRPTQITDNFGRTIQIRYDGTKKEQVTGIKYKNPNGTDTTISYGYDSNGNFSSVQLGDLPKKMYDYTWHDPGFKKYVAYDKQSRWGGLGHEWKRRGSVIDWDDREFRDEDRIDVSDVTDYNGYILTSTQSGLGSRVAYQYQASLQYSIGLDPEFDREYLLAAGYPVVVQKRVYESVSDVSPKIYRIVFPNDSTGYIRNVRAFMYPRYISPKYIKESQRQYYFGQVTIDNPSEMEDETTYFDQSMPIRKVQGINSQETDWDFTLMRQLRTRSKLNGITQAETVYESYDAYNNPTSVLIKNGSTPYQRTTVTYATLPNNLLHIPALTTVKELTTNKEKSSYTTYTDLGKPYEVFEGSNASGKKLKSVTYDTAGRVNQETSYGPAGSLSVSYAYTGGGNTTYRITQSANGKTSYTNYEPYTGRAISQTDANGNTGTITYDTYGRPVTQTDPTGQQTSYTYSSDLKTTSVTGKGRTVTQIVDNFGRPIETQYPSGEENTKTEYYFSNLPKAVYKKQNGSWVLKQSFTYDTYLRKRTSLNPDWGTTTYTYDDANHQVTITDPTGRTSQKKMNTLGQTDYTIGVDGLYTRFTYDGFGNTTQVQDPRNLIHDTSYDNYGRITTSYYTHNLSTSKKTRSETQYFDNGQVKQTTIKNEDGSNFRTYAYTYDTEGRLTQTQLNNTSVETLTYDSGANAKGALTTAENTDAKTQYSYDTLGRITQETVTIKPLNKTYGIQTGYNNANGQIASVTFPDAKAIQYAYDSHQRVNQINYNNAPTPLIQYTYNPNGTVQTMTYANGTVTTYTYTKDVLLTDLVVRDKNQAILYEQHYRYNDRGNVAGTAHSDYLTGTPGIQRLYSYDIKDQVAQVFLNANSTTTLPTMLSLPGTAPTYTHKYDANGNILRFETQHNKDLGQDNITIDNNYDRILEKRYKDGKKIQMTYDAVGNLIGKTRINGGTSTTLYSYNDQDQLSSVKEDGITIASYGYDHKRQRVYSNSPGVQTYDGQKVYYWDTQGRIIGEQNISYAGVNTNAATVRYIYSGNQKVAMARPKDLYDIRAGEDIYYFINNAQGTPVLIVDSTGKSVSKINLDEWGNPGTVVGSRAEINYTGKKLDARTGLYYFNQRYYDPEIGRFLTEDPKGQAFNPYLYSGNNPLMYVDPDGQLWWLALGALVGGVAANWGKPFDLETFVNGAFIGAIGAAWIGAAVGLETVAVNWSVVAGVGGFGAGVGGALGTLGGNVNPSPDHLGGGSPNRGHGAVPGINGDMNRPETRQLYNNWARSKNASTLFENYSGTGVFDGIGEVGLNDLGISTPKNRLDSLRGDWDTLSGYSGGGHSINMALLTGRADANTVNIYGGGFANYEGIASYRDHFSRAVNVYWSVNDPVSWCYGSTGPSGPMILIMPNGRINGVNYIPVAGKSHQDWIK